MLQQKNKSHMKPLILAYALSKSTNTKITIVYSAMLWRNPGLISKEQSFVSFTRITEDVPKNKQTNKQTGRRTRVQQATALFQRREESPQQKHGCVRGDCDSCTVRTFRGLLPPRPELWGGLRPLTPDPQLHGTPGSYQSRSNRSKWHETAVTWWQSKLSEWSWWFDR